MVSQIDTSKYPLSDKTYKVISACMNVHNELGCGFLEPVYQEALSIELEKNNIPFEQEKFIDVFYSGIKLEKKYIADFICFNEIIVELKAVESISKVHVAQVLNYLKATGFRVGLLINFGNTRLQRRRLIL